MTDIFGDSLGVGDRQEAVLLVGTLQDLGCRLASGETGQITVMRGIITQSDCRQKLQLNVILADFLDEG